MSLDDRLANLKVEEYGTVPKPATKQSILTDLLEMLKDEPVKGSPFEKSFYTARNQLRQELRDIVRKYCE